MEPSWEPYSCARVRVCDVCVCVRVCMRVCACACVCVVTNNSRDAFIGSLGWWAGALGPKRTTGLVLRLPPYEFPYGTFGQDDNRVLRRWRLAAHSTSCTR